LGETKSYQFTINPVKNRTVYLWYRKIMEQETDVVSAIIRHALEKYYESGGVCTSIAKLHDKELPSDAEPVKVNLYIGTGPAKKLLDTMKANRIAKSKAIHAVMEGSIEFVPDTEKETLFLPTKKRSYKGVLSAMSDILQAHAGMHANTKKMEEEVPIIRQAKPVIKDDKPDVKPVTIMENRTAGERKKKTVAALSGRRG